VARGKFWPPPPPAPAARARVDDADRDLLADEDLGRAVVERHDARLALHVGERRLLQRVDEARELEAPERAE
jgi:hypothetical protein